MNAHGNAPASSRSTVWSDRMDDLRRHRPTTDQQLAQRLRDRRRAACRPVLARLVMMLMVMGCAAAVVRLPMVPGSLEALAAFLVSCGLDLVGLWMVLGICRRLLQLSPSSEDAPATPQQIADLALFASRVPEIAVLMSDWMVHGPMRQREVQMLQEAWNLWRADHACPAIFEGVQFERPVAVGA